MKNSSQASQRPAGAQALQRAMTRRRMAHDDRCPDGVIHITSVRTARRRLPTAREISRATELFGLLANETRLKLVLALLPEPARAVPELCVCDLAAVSGASESMTSHQLRILRHTRLVQYRRAGKLVLYRLTTGPQAHLLLDALDYVRTNE